MNREEAARMFAACTFIYCPICEPERVGLIALPCVACHRRAEEEKFMKTPLEILLARVDWLPTGAAGVDEDGIPYATHTGILRIAGCELNVARLSTGQAVIEAESLDRFFKRLFGQGGFAE
jgi:hypothetical protein